MGRSRVVNNSTDDDPASRSKRRRIISSGENLENVPTGAGTTDGKKALYHCNYCNKDITGKIRIKCTKCPDFDLCVECFSVGAEITPHKCNHPYRVMDNLSFPLIASDWFGDEEILLLEAIEMYGLANWTEVAEHVGTKSKDQCIEHYTSIYMNSPCFPIPDMSHVLGKNRKELLAMAKGPGDGKQGFLGIGDGMTKEESPFSPSRVKIEDGTREVLPGRLSPIVTADGESGEFKLGGVGSTTTVQLAGANKKATNLMHVKDGSDRIKQEDSQGNRSIGGKKPKYLVDEGPSLTELSGYNPKRQEFDSEYDNDAENLLAEMEFKETDTETERELKLRVLHIYGSRLDERKRRKNFILERNLLYPNPLEKDLTEDEKEIYECFKVFMRFQTQEEHETLMRTLIEEHRLRKRIRELQEARAAGCHTRAEADAYLEQRAAQRNDGSQVGSSKVLQKVSRPIKGEYDGSPGSIGENNKTKVTGGLENSSRDSSCITNSFDDWDITGLPGVDLLSEMEKQFCCGNRLLPCHLLRIQEVLVKEILTGSIVKKDDAYGLFKVDPQKVDKIYDMVLRKLDMHQDSSAISLPL